MARSRLPLRRLLPVGLILPLGLLSACSGELFERTEQRPCPPVLLESSTATLTQFRPGAGRDLTDVVLEAELVGYRGECQYDDDANTVTVDLALDMTASLGPAATERTQSLQYFVALPRFYPNARGKQVFETTLAFPESMNRVRYVGEELSIEVPMDPNESALDYPIYIGFQLTHDQVEFNRTQQ